MPKSGNLQRLLPIIKDIMEDEGKKTVADVIQMLSDDVDYSSQLVPDGTSVKVNSVEEFLKDLSLIHLAAYCGWTEVIRILLAKGVSANTITSVSKQNPLHCLSTQWANQKTNPETIQLLLQAGADINALDVDGYTPLMRLLSHLPGKCEFDAKEKHDVKASWALLLLEKGASIKGELGIHSLCLSIHSTFLCDELIKRGVSIHGQFIPSLPPEKSFPIVSAVNAYDNLELFNWYLSQGVAISGTVGADCLIYAIKKGLKKELESLLTLGINPCTPNRQGIYPISAAVQHSPHLCTILENAGADKKHLTEEDHALILNRQVLTYLQNGSTVSKAKNLLLTQNVDITLVPEEHDKQLLHYAVHYDLPEIVDILLQRGADVNAPDGNNQTPLHYAVDREIRMASAERLIQQGADVNAVDNKGFSPFSYLNTFDGDASPLIDLMFNNGLDLSHGFNRNCLRQIMRLANNSLLKMMVDHGLDLQIALPSAAECKNIDAFQYLLSNGATINSENAAELLDSSMPYEEDAWNEIRLQCLNLIEDIDVPIGEVGYSLFIRSVRCNNFHFAELLLSRGANINYVNKNGNAMDWCIRYKNEDGAQFLIAQRFDFSGEVGISNLKYSVHLNADSISHLLLTQPLDINRIKNGSTILQFAIDANKKLPIINKLLTAKANPNTKGEALDYPLVMAVQQNNVKLIKELLLHGADPGIKFKGNTTIATWAKKSKKPGIADMFSMSLTELKQYSPPKVGFTFTNKRLLLAETDNWSAVIKSQLEHSFGFSDPEKIKGEQQEIDIEYVDVIDSITGKNTYQLLLTGMGGGVFEWDQAEYLGSFDQDENFRFSKKMTAGAKTELCRKFNEAYAEFKESSETLDNWIGM